MDPEAGLTRAEVDVRRKTNGYNEVTEQKGHPVLKFLGKFWGVSAWMLELIMVLSAVLRKYSDLAVVSALLVVNAVLSFIQERRAAGVIETLRRRLQVSARVLRDADWQVIPARELVPGDIVRVRPGDIVPADVKLLTGTLSVDQSALTGESMEVDIAPDGVLSSGSVVRRGEGNGVVMLTGAKTYFGRTTELVQEARPKLHIEAVVAKVVRWLFVIVGALLGLVIVLSIIRGAPLLEMVPLMLVLLMSAVPVALPVMFTVSMAFGSKELAKRGVLVTRLSAAEDAATMDVLCVDKSKAKLFAENETMVTFADVAGIDEAKEELQEVVEFLKNPAKFQKLGGRIPKGVLLVGPPGTGKTLLAKAVAGEAKVPFFSISGSEFVEMFVSVGASRVRDLFSQAASQAPCIIFIDELDALGKARGVNAFGGNDEREQTLNQLLVEMDGFESNKGVIIMSATNRPEILDPALLRPGRFDRQVLLDRPDINGREAILKIHSRKVLLGPDVDLRKIAGLVPGFAGAELANLVNEAALLAARKDKETIGAAEFDAAIDRAVGGLEKKNRVMNPQEKEIVAFHESGHAIVAESVKHADRVHKISVIPRGIAALGYTQQQPTEDRYLMTRPELLDRLAVLLGGRVAEELVFGEISTGAQNDLQRATAIARSMVAEYGMSDRLGLVTYEPARQPMFLPENYTPNKTYSETKATQIDEEISAVMEQTHQRVRNILSERRKVLDSLAHLLSEKEIVQGEELRQMLSESANQVVSA